MSTDNIQHAPPELVSQRTFEVRVNDELVVVGDRTPTGRQVLAAAGLRPDTEFALLHWPPQGPTREVALEEVMTIPQVGPPLEFFARRADHVSYFVLDDDRYAWAGLLSVETLRRIGRLPASRELWLERRDEADLLLTDSDYQIKLDRPGVERLYTRARVWRLDVQGEATEWDHPRVVVRDALIKAGIDLSVTWRIVLKMKGLPHESVGLDDVIDLARPGIERLWLRPANVDNGDGQLPNREFALLPKDQSFLETASYRWATVVEGGRRWLVIEDYAVPAGFNVSSCRLAIEIPNGYPTAQLDMFFCHPPLTLPNGAQPPATEHRETIAGVPFQRWSRHRNGSNPWSPTRDSVVTQLALVDEALGREVGS